MFLYAAVPLLCLQSPEFGLFCRQFTGIVVLHLSGRVSSKGAFAPSPLACCAAPAAVYCKSHGLHQEVIELVLLAVELCRKGLCLQQAAQAGSYMNM